MHTIEPTRIPVSELLFSQIGTTTTIEVNLPELTDSEVTFLPNQTLHFEGMKIEDGICIYSVVQDLNGTYSCTRCLKEVSDTITLRPLEKQFYVKIPEDVEDDLVQKIDAKHFEISLVPLIEETVYLSIPTILRCGEDCKGLTHYETIKDPKNPSTHQNPFSDLKNLLK